jgi:ribose-phosphate pyrophosphokinase
MRVYTFPEPRPLERLVAKEIFGQARHLAEWKVFPGGEHFVHVRGVDRRATVVARIEPPADNLLRTLLLLDTLQRNGSRQIDLVAPYFAYSRQDRPRREGDCLSALFVAKQIADMGASRIITVEMHSDRTIEASPIPIVNVSMIADLAERFRELHDGKPITVVSPDLGSVKRAAVFAAAWQGAAGVMWIEKYRSVGGEITARKVVGEAVGKTAILVDDMVDTGATVLEAVEMLRENGFRNFHLATVHPVFSGGAVRTVAKCKFGHVVLTDTLPLPRGLAKSVGKLTVVKCGGKLVEAIRK